jgi:hypothetical protein
MGVVLVIFYFALWSACGTVRSALGPGRPNSICMGISFASETITHARLYRRQETSYCMLLGQFSSFDIQSGIPI